MVLSLRKGTLAVSDGARIAFWLYEARANAPRVVLVHSLAMTGAFWTPVARILADKGWSVLAPDCRGHGASSKPEGAYHIGRFADDLAELLEHLGWGEAVVAGASMGGSVALAFAAAHPAKVSALGLFDTTAWYGPDAPAAWAGRAAKAREEGLESLVAFQTSRWFTDAFRERSPQTVQDCVDIFLANDVDAYAATCAMMGTMDLREALARVACPVAIRVGEEDYATPLAMSEALHAALPDGELEVIAGGRHLTPLEFPDQIASAIEKLAPRA